MLKNILSQWEKVAKCNFKSKAQVHEKMFLSNEMNSFLQCRRQIFMCLSFFAEKVILELNAQKSLFRASKKQETPILCFSATSKWWDCEAQMLKNIFLSEKTLC